MVHRVPLEPTPIVSVMAAGTHAAAGTDTAKETPMHTPRRRHLIGLAGLALTAATLVPGVPAGAQTSGSTGTGTATVLDANLHPRLERACLRIPNLELRTTNLEKRLDGDASTIGSLAWLQAKVDQAKAAHRDQLATVLENRLAVRKKTRQVLDQRQADLQRLQKRCGELGVSQ